MIHASGPGNFMLQRNMTWAFHRSGGVFLPRFLDLRAKVQSMQNANPKLADPVEPRGELASRTLAMPADANPNGDVFGGWIMARMDAAALMTAMHDAKGRVVTVAVSNITFLRPVAVGDAVCCYTDLVRIGNTSLTLHVEVWVRRQGQGERVKVTDAELSLVAVDDEGRPRRIPVA
jgi:acyl-CoA thioesterase YciA